MKTFLCSIEIEVPVVAETEEEAKEIAHKALQSNDMCLHYSDWDCAQMRRNYIPIGYGDRHDLVWHNQDRDITLEESWAWCCQDRPSMQIKMDLFNKINKDTP